jgi:hypothetical protein
MVCRKGLHALPGSCFHLPAQQYLLAKSLTCAACMSANFNEPQYIGYLWKLNRAYEPDFSPPHVQPE